MPNLYRPLSLAVIAVAVLLCGSAQDQKPQAAPPPSPLPQAAPHATADPLLAENAILKRKLDEVVPEVEFSAMPLGDVLVYLRDLAKINLVIEWGDLQASGIADDQKVTIHLKGLPLKVILTEVLRQSGVDADTDVGYVIRDGVVRIATQAKLRRDAALLAEVRFKDVSLPKVIEFLRAADPGFQVVLAADPGLSAEQLTISELELCNVTASQVVQALQAAYPQIRVTPTGDLPPIWTVRVMVARGGDAQKVTSVFRLREAIDQVQRDMQLDDRGKARDAVLLLLERALTIDADLEQRPVLQLHQATDTLVFRGTSEQMLVVNNALTALRSPAKAAAPGPRQTESGATPEQPTERRAAPERSAPGGRGEGSRSSTAPPESGGQPHPAQTPAALPPRAGSGG